MAFLAPIAAIAGGVKSVADAASQKNKYGARAPIENLTNQQQLGTAYNQTQQGLSQQQAFLNALQGQNGIQNQSQLVNQLQGVAAGTGPSAAQAQLQQATGANVANQAALMAGQRGAGANVGLIGRQAAQQGGALQQQAAGQAATLRAQEQLNAMGQLGGITGQQVAQQAAATTGYSQAAQQQQQQLLQAMANQNSAQNQASATQAGLAAGAQQQQAAGIGNLTGAIGTGLGMIGGGTTPTANQSGGLNTAPWSTTMAADGGMITAQPVKGGPKSRIGQHLLTLSNGGSVMVEDGMVPGKAKVKGDSQKNDTVPALLSAGEIVIPRSIAQGANAAMESAKFVHAILSKNKLR